MQKDEEEMKKDESLKFFGEVAYYRITEENGKAEAQAYLNFWKKNLLFKLKRDSFQFELVDETWTTRNPEHIGCFMNSLCSLSLKICLKGSFNYDLENMSSYVR